MTVMDLRELVDRGRDVKKVIKRKLKEYQLRGQLTDIFPERVNLTYDYSTFNSGIVDKAYTLFTVIVAQMLRNKSNRVHYTVDEGHDVQTDLILLNLVPGVLLEGSDLGEAGYLDLKLNVGVSVTGQEFYAKRYYDYALALLN